METLLEKLYTDPSSPAAYSGVENLLREARRLDPNDVESYIQGQSTYTLFKPRRVRYRRLQTVPSGYMTDMQADLADFQQISAHNRGYRYLLVTIDVLSRQIFAAPVKSKRAEHMKDAFEEIFAQTPHHPWTLYTDKGNEFEAKEMKKFFKDKEIQKIASQSDDVKASVAERAIQTLKARLYRYFSNRNDLCWVDVVSKVVDAVNRAPSRAISGMRPIDVNETNWKPLWNRLYAHNFKRSATRKEKHYSVGTKVRIDKYKGRFDRGFHPNFTDEIFTVKRALPTQPRSYRIEDRNQEEILGRFYNPNLSKTKDYAEVTHRISKVHKERTRSGRKEYLVSFVGHDANIRRWIGGDQLVS
jgi:hypothetical protein